MRVLIVGCGYVGMAAGAELVRRGHEVFGLRRSASADAEMRELGIVPVRGDATQAAELARLPYPIDWVVNTLSSTRGGLEDYRRVYLQGMEHLVGTFLEHPIRKFVYTSSTGVYGQEDGALVEENAPTDPQSETGQVLVAAEQVLLQGAIDRQFPAVILRVAGIYGPGRTYWLRQFLAGQAPATGQGERWMNMIHRDDLVGMIVAALERGRPGAVYNAVDDEPVTQSEFFAWLARATQRPVPSPVPGTAPPTKRNPGNKWVSNRKIKTELGYNLKFPSYREGYAEELRRWETHLG